MGDKRIQRITVGVIIGVIVISLALSLISAAAAPLSAADVASLGPVSTPPTPTDPGSLGDNGPKPVTKTPQGTPTQVSDREHIGGLIGYTLFMAGGVVLFLRSRRREARGEAAQEADSILSASG